MQTHYAHFFSEASRWVVVASRISGISLSWGIFLGLNQAALVNAVYAAPPNGYPSSETTGVPAGTVLTPYTGACTVSINNAVIDAKTINCNPLLINAQNVTVTRSYIQGSVCVNVTVGVCDTGSDLNSLIIKDSEIHGSNFITNSGPTGLGEKNWQAKRVKITGFRRMAHCLGNCTLESSFLQSDVVPDPTCNPDCTREPYAIHASAMRIGPGPVIIKNSTLSCNMVDVNEAGCSANLTIYGEYGQVHDAIVENSLLLATGGGYAAYGGNSHGRTDAYNVVFRDNRWGRRNVDNTLGNSQSTESGGQTSGYYGSITSMDVGSGNPGNVWSGNYYYNNGGVLTLARNGTTTGADVTQPTVPMGLSAMGVSASQINLDWSASTDNIAIAGYDIERCDGVSCWDYNLLTQTDGTGTTYSNTGLTNGTRYTYRVRARDTNANMSRFSSVASAIAGGGSVPPNAPRGLRVE
jgi:hypothetical protein